MDTPAIRRLATPTASPGREKGAWEALFALRVRRAVAAACGKQR